MRLGRVAADDKDRLGVVDVIVAVGHRAIAPGVCNTGNCGRVTDTRLMVHVVRAPIGGELTEQIGLFVVMLGGTQPVNGIRAAFLANVHHPIADLVDRLLPRDALPLTTLFLHRVLEAALTMSVLAHGGTFGAMGPKVERAVPAGLLPCPDAVGDLSNNGTPDRAVGADGFHQINFACRRRCRVGLRHGTARGGDCGKATNGQARSAQKRAAVYGFFRNV